ncbi:hypothetical protein [Rickettsia tamurae]|nr:hypothetical protein [Rickettsia tamurae]
MQNFKINSKSVANMVAQIRVKQLAIRDSQNKIQKIIVEERGKKFNKSNEELVQEIEDKIQQYLETSKAINNYLKDQSIDDVELKYNKTDIQLKMVYEYVKQQKGNLIDQIIKKKFYHGLSNDISPNELPVLQSDSRISYWGNENSSVSSVLLKSIAKILKAETPTMIGAATFYLI